MHGTGTSVTPAPAGREIFKLVDESRSEMWKINEKFIRNQCEVSKTFYFSHDPNNINIIIAGSYYDMEIEFIRNFVKEKYGKSAKFVRYDQYWKLEW